MWPLDKLALADGVAGEEDEPEFAAMLAKKAAWDPQTQGQWDGGWEQRVTRRAQTHRQRQAAALRLAKKNFDGLVIVTRFHPKTILLELLPYLGLSRSFAVFFPNIEVCGCLSS